MFLLDLSVGSHFLIKNHRITESTRLEKTLKIMESNKLPPAIASEESLNSVLLP